MVTLSSNDGLADDEDDGDQRVKCDVMEVKVLEPAREKMEDEEEIYRSRKRRRSPARSERRETCRKRLLFVRDSASHPSHFAVDQSVGRASLAFQARFPFAPGGFLSTFQFAFSGKIMADAANKYPENVAGTYYVDDQCIDCDLCRETAPANYKRNDDGGHSFVYKQPESPEEEALCKEAMEGCPVEAIGADGGLTGVGSVRGTENTATGMP